MEKSSDINALYILSYMYEYMYTWRSPCNVTKIYKQSINIHIYIYITIKKHKGWNIQGYIMIYIYIYINIYVHICMNRCILGEINEKTYILAKSPKVHKGGGSTPQPIGGYFKGPIDLLWGCRWMKLVAPMALIRLIFMTYWKTYHGNMGARHDS